MSIPLPDLTALGEPVALVAHDAGAANMIVSWAAAQPGVALRACMAGPALTIWERAFPGRPTLPLDVALDGAGYLLSGSGWAGPFEHAARANARVRGMPVVAVVDHWVNYRSRFVRDGVEILPDVIWVGDRYAARIARHQFPRIEVREYANRYLDGEVEAVRGLDAMIPRSRPGDRILYALEPIRLPWDSDDPRPGEFQALDYFMSRLGALGLAPDCEIRLRPHPSDPGGKYDAWIGMQKGVDVALAPDQPIAEAVHWANWIAGCESFVLIIGVAAGRHTVSTLPPWGNELRLPHEEIIRLREL